MRIAIQIYLPQDGVLSMARHIEQMEIIDKTAEREASEQYEHHKLVSRKFVGHRGGRIAARYVFNVRGQRQNRNSLYISGGQTNSVYLGSTGTYSGGIFVGSTGTATIVNNNISNSITVGNVTASTLSGWRTGGYGEF